MLERVEVFIFFGVPILLPLCYTFMDYYKIT